MWSGRFASARSGGTIFWRNLRSMEWNMKSRNHELVYTPTVFCTNMHHFLITLFFSLCLFVYLYYSPLHFSSVFSSNLSLSSFPLKHIFLPLLHHRLFLVFSHSLPSTFSSSFLHFSFFLSFLLCCLLLSILSLFFSLSICIHSISGMTTRPPLSKSM